MSAASPDIIPHVCDCYGPPGIRQDQDFRKMLNLPCQCGHRFSEPEDTAGRSIQCPKCHRLVDVPTLGDLPGILPDGTYSMDAPAARDPQKLASMLRAFNRDTHDEGGSEKDLRPTLDDVLRAGVP